MRERPRGIAEIERAVGHIEALEGLERALDKQYRRIVESARSDWERLFPEKDPSHVCVEVRIRGEDSKSVLARRFLKPASGLLPSVAGPQLASAQGVAK